MERTLNQLVALATKFDGGPEVVLNGRIIPPEAWPQLESNFPHYSVEARKYEDVTRWAVCRHGFCLSKSEGDFIYESMPSDRTDDFIQDTRFDTVQEAFDALEAHKVKAIQDATKLGWQVWKP